MKRHPLVPILALGLLGSACPADSEAPPADKVEKSDAAAPTGADKADDDDDDDDDGGDDGG